METDIESALAVSRELTGACGSSECGVEGANRFEAIVRSAVEDWNRNRHMIVARVPADHPVTRTTKPKGVHISLDASLKFADGNVRALNVLSLWAVHTQPSSFHLTATLEGHSPTAQLTRDEWPQEVLAALADCDPKARGLIPRSAPRNNQVNLSDRFEVGSPDFEQLTSWIRDVAEAVGQE